MSGIGFIDGLDFKQNATTTQGHSLQQGKQYTVETTVRKAGQDSVKVVVRVDGKQIIEWTGAPSSLSLVVPNNPGGPHAVVKAGKERFFWLQSNGDSFAVSKLELRPIGDHSQGPIVNDSSMFVGQWDCGDVVITLNADFTAHKNRPNPLGKWECVNGEARMAWDDGRRTVLRRDGQGFQKLTWNAGVSMESPPSNTFPAVKGKSKQRPAAFHCQRVPFW